MASRSESFPNLLLVRDACYYTTALYLERSLMRKCNVIPIAIDSQNLLFYSGAHQLGELSRALSTFLLKRFVQALKRFTSVEGVLVHDPIRMSLDLDFLSVPKAFYSLDPDVVAEHVKRTKITTYDVVFASHKNTIPRYEAAGCANVVWLPPAADPKIHRPMNLSQMYDFCFIGHQASERRRNFAREVRSRLGGYRLFLGTAYLNNLARTYSMSKVALNNSAMGDLNTRVFEALACGKLLLTDKADDGLPGLFEDRKHLVVYSDFDEMEELARYYLENVDDRERIAAQGRAEVLSKHTYDHRADQILESMGLA